MPQTCSADMEHVDSGHLPCVKYLRIHFVKLIEASKNKFILR